MNICSKYTGVTTKIDKAAEAKAVTAAGLFELSANKLLYFFLFFILSLLSFFFVFVVEDRGFKSSIWYSLFVVLGHTCVHDSCP